MKVEEIVEQARESLGSKRVFGEPYEKNGVTVIPAARVMGGAGGGDAGDRAAQIEGADGAKTGTGTGTGAGYGMVGSPAGAFVIKGDDVKWLPAVDVNRLMFGFQLMLIVLFLVVRSILKSRVPKPA